MLFSLIFYFFFNDTATTEIYTLSLHDALPIWAKIRPPAELSCRGPVMPGYVRFSCLASGAGCRCRGCSRRRRRSRRSRSEEHTSELQSRQYLVCRLLLEKKKKKKTIQTVTRL